MSALLKADISDKEVTRGKGLLKASIAENADGGKLVDFFANQVSADSLVSPQQLISAVDSVTAADVKQVSLLQTKGNTSKNIFEKSAF